MVKVLILGQGYVASTFVAGLEKLKKGEIEPYGVPLAGELPIDFKDIRIVGSYDVDRAKIGKKLSEVVSQYWCDVNSLSDDPVVSTGVHLGSVKNLPIEAEGLEDSMTLKEAIERLVDEWSKLDPDVIVNTCTTEAFKPFGNKEELLKAIENNDKERLTATQVYAYAATLYAKNAVEQPL